MSCPEEVQRFVSMRGKNMSLAFVFFMVSTLVYCLYIIVWSIAYSRTWGGAIFILVLTVGGFNILNGYTLLGVVRDMHNTKFESMQSQHTTGSLDPGPFCIHKRGPLVLERKQIQEYIVALSGKLGDPRLISPQAVRTYIQDSESKETELQEGKRYMSWMTAKVVEEEVESAFQALYHGGQQPGESDSLQSYTARLSVPPSDM